MKISVSVVYKQRRMASWITSDFALRRPRISSFTNPTKWKSDGARSGLHGGWERDFRPLFESPPCAEKRCRAVLCRMVGWRRSFKSLACSALSNFWSTWKQRSSLVVLLVAAIRQICIIQQSKRQFPWPNGLRIAFSVNFSWAMLCDAIPSFSLSDQRDEHIFCHPSPVVTEVAAAFDSIPFQRLWENTFSL
jgi:hypothetical protein